MKAFINFYEDTNQFNQKEVEFVSYDKDSLFDYVSEKLNRQMDLGDFEAIHQFQWASIWIEGKPGYTVTRVSDTEVTVWDSTTGERYPYTPKSL